MSMDVATIDHEFPDKQAVSPMVLETVLLGGDLSKLSSPQRIEYYLATCKSLGLNPLTKPFEFLKLQGDKLILYPKRDCTDQLRKVHSISLRIISRDKIGDAYVVTAQATMGDRYDESTGVVSIVNLKGEALANAMMKAETKSKRRVTLSISGLGWADETEIDTIPGVKRESDIDKKPVSEPLQQTSPLSDEKTSIIRAITASLRERFPHESPNAYVKFIPDEAMEAVRVSFGVQKWAELKGKSLEDLQSAYEDFLQVLTPQEVSEGELLDDDVPDFSPESPQDESSTTQASDAAAITNNAPTGPAAMEVTQDQEPLPDTEATDQPPPETVTVGPDGYVAWADIEVLKLWAEVHGVIPAYTQAMQKIPRHAGDYRMTPTHYVRVRAVIAEAIAEVPHG